MPITYDRRWWQRGRAAHDDTVAVLRPVVYAFPTTIYFRPYVCTCIHVNVQSVWTVRKGFVPGGDSLSIGFWCTLVQPRSSAWLRSDWYLGTQRTRRLFHKCSYVFGQTYCWLTTLPFYRVRVRIQSHSSSRYAFLNILPFIRAWLCIFSNS
jgi:hypothetical protein